MKRFKFDKREGNFAFLMDADFRKSVANIYIVNGKWVITAYRWDEVTADELREVAAKMDEFSNAKEPPGDA